MTLHNTMYAVIYLMHISIHNSLMYAMRILPSLCFVFFSFFFSLDHSLLLLCQRDIYPDCCCELHINMMLLSHSLHYFHHGSKFVLKSVSVQGVRVTLPVPSYCEPWQGHMYFPSALFHGTTQP